jgi:hypothetical protein
MDEEQLRDLYIDIVRRVSGSFLAGVQANIRMRVFANPLPLLRVIIDPTYSCTVRMGELVEKHLFARTWPVGPGAGPCKNANRSLKLCDLQIIPYNFKSSHIMETNVRART